MRWKKIHCIILEFEYISRDLHLAIGMDMRGLREQDLADRQLDRQAMDSQLAALAQDQQRLLVALGVGSKEVC